MNMISRKISKKTRILPQLIPLIIPGFEKHSEPIIPLVLSYKAEDSRVWYEEFINKLDSKIGKEYYPVMRFSDGEYKFILGEQPPVYSGNKIHFIKTYIKYIYRKIAIFHNFEASTLPGVSSGSYSKIETQEIKKNYANWVRNIAKKGILALHLTYSKNPFQEHYHSKFKKWMIQNNIMLTSQNYFPFYFVYAALRGNDKIRLLKNRRILIVHSATGRKKESIFESLRKEGVLNIEWLTISSSRAMFDNINIDNYKNKIDIVFLGAGVGKPNILVQLEPLNVPCIDAGFVFEVWAEDENKWLRPMMVPDSEWDESKIRFR